jgi:hypothetical protein
MPIKTTIDLFPRTGKNEKHNPDIKMNGSFHVETVVLMSRVKE